MREAVIGDPVAGTMGRLGQFKTLGCHEFCTHEKECAAHMVGRQDGQNSIGHAGRWPIVKGQGDRSQSHVSLADKLWVEGLVGYEE